MIAERTRLIARDEVIRAVGLIAEPGGVIELRILNATIGQDRWERNYSGFFDDHEKLAEELGHIERASGCYVTLNPVDGDLLARANNRLKKSDGKGNATSDKDITSRRWLLIDVDPQRPTGISASDNEKDQSKTLVEEINLYLHDLGWPLSIKADSGNGYHLLFRIDLPKDDDGLVQRCLKALSASFDNDAVHVDTTVHNPARISKLYGTLACKGDSTDDRPHRMSRILNSPDAIEVVPVELLEALAGEVVEEDARPVPSTNGFTSDHIFDVEGFIDRNGLDVGNPTTTAKSTTWEFRTSPMCDHADDGPWLTQFADGAISAGCHHNSCDWKWAELRARFEPKVQPAWGSENNSAKAASTTKGDDWPDPQPFDCEKLPAFPVDALPDPLGAWSEATAEATQTPVDLAAMQGLTVCSAAMAGRIDCQVRIGYVETINLYTATMMPPANRKSSVHSAATKPLRDYEQQLREKTKAEICVAGSERRIQEKRLASLEKQAAGDSSKSTQAQAEARNIATWLDENPTPVLPEIITDDATVEALAMAMQQQGGTIASFSAEGGCFDIMAGRYSSQANFDLFLKSHSGDRFRQTRISRTPIEIERPVLTCGYTLQPHHFEQLAAQKDLRGRGLLGRFLYSIPASYIGKRLAAAEPVSEGLTGQYHDTISRLCHLPAGTFVLSEEADIRLQGWFDELEPRLGIDGDLQYIADWAGKLVGATARVAAIIQAVKQGDEWEPTRAVDVGTVESAIEIARYLIPHAERAFGLLSGHGSHESAAQEILRKIQTWMAGEPGRLQFTRRDLHQKVRRQYALDELDGPLDELVERGWLRRGEQSDRRRGPAYLIHARLRGKS